MDSDTDSENQLVDYLIDIKEKGNRFGVYKDQSFRAISNFKIEILYEVKNDKGPLSGYICSVTLVDGCTLT